MRAILLGFAAALFLAASVAAKPPLRDVRAIDDGLLAVGIADEIRKKCDDIAGRMLRAANYIATLERRAKSLGYSDKEIESYVTSRDEKRRMRARGEAWLAANGVTSDAPDSYCDAGRAEIARGSPIGVLLRAK